MEYIEQLREGVSKSIAGNTVLQQNIQRAKIRDHKIPPLQITATIPGGGSAFLIAISIFMGLFN